MVRFVHCIFSRRPHTSGIDEVDECNNFGHESFGNHQLWEISAQTEVNMELSCVGVYCTFTHEN